MRTHPPHSTRVLLLACALTVLLFLLDVVMPQANLWGLLLLPVIVVFLWGRRRDIYVVAVLGGALVVAGYRFGTPHSPAGILVNHLLPLGIFWAVAWLMAQRRELQEQLQQRGQELDEQVKARTAALAASEEHCRALFDHAGDGIFSVDDASRYVEVNDRYCRMLGRTRTEIAGAHLNDMTVGVTPEFIAAVGEELKQHGSATFERQLRHKDGTFPEVEVTVAPLSGGGRMAIVRAISQRKAAEREPLFLSALVTSSPEAVVGRKVDGTILSWNRGAERLFGYTAEEAVGQNMSILAGPEGLAHQEEVNSEIAQGNAVENVETRRRTKDGRIVDCRISSFPVCDHAGEIIGAASFAHDITERKRLEEETYRLAAIVGSSSDAIVSTDQRGLITSWNHSAEQLYGCSADQAIGRPAGEFFPPSEGTDEAEVIASLRRGNTVPIADLVRTKADGTKVDLSIILSPVKDKAGTVIGTASAARDITPLKRAEAQLREAYQRLRLAADAAGIGVWSWNYTGDRLEWDERTCELHSVTAEERRAGITYGLWRARIHPDDLALAEPRDNDPTRLIGHWSSTYRIVLPGGEIRHIQSRALVENGPDDRPRRIVGVNRDVSDQVRYEQLLQETNATLERRVAARTADLQSALADLQRANKLKDEFMAMVSHELRTPLTGVLSMSEMLAEQVAGPLNARQAGYVQAITRSGERLLAVVSGILSYTHLLSGKIQLDPERVELAHLLDTCAASQRHKAAAKDQLIAVQVDPTDLTFRADPTALAEILKRLLDNAVKFTPPSGRIGLAAGPGITPGTVDLVVWDSGAGIPPEQFEQIFHAFVQGDGTLTRPHEGLGLGLAYVDEMVRLLGGTITVASEPRKGTRFTITLPLAADAY